MCIRDRDLTDELATGRVNPDLALGLADLETGVAGRMVLPLVINGDGIGSTLNARPGPDHGPFRVGFGSRVELD